MFSRWLIDFKRLILRFALSFGRITKIARTFIALDHLHNLGFPIFDPFGLTRGLGKDHGRLSVRDLAIKVNINKCN